MKLLKIETYGHLKVKSETKTKIEEISRITGMTLSEVVNRAINRFDREIVGRVREIYEEGEGEKP